MYPVVYRCLVLVRELVRVAYREIDDQTKVVGSQLRVSAVEAELLARLSVHRAGVHDEALLERQSVSCEDDEIQTPG